MLFLTALAALILLTSLTLLAGLTLLLAALTLLAGLALLLATLALLPGLTLLLATLTFLTLLFLLALLVLGLVTLGLLIHLDLLGENTMRLFGSRPVPWQAPCPARQMPDEALFF